MADHGGGYTYKVFVGHAKDLEAKDMGGTSDAYCTCWIGNASAHTNVITGSLNPEWNETLYLESTTSLKPQLLIIDVKDRDQFLKDEELGRVIVSLRRPDNVGLLQGCYFMIRAKSNKFTHTQGKILLRVECFERHGERMTSGDQEWTPNMRRFMELNHFNVNFKQNRNHETRQSVQTLRQQYGDINDDYVQVGHDTGGHVIASASNVGVSMFPNPPVNSPIMDNEIIMWMKDELIFKLRGINYKGTLIITNARLLICTSCTQSFDIVNTNRAHKILHSMSIPFGLIWKMEIKESRVHGGVYGGSGTSAKMCQIRCRDVRTVQVIFPQTERSSDDMSLRELKVVVKCNLASRTLFAPAYTLTPRLRSERWERFDFATEFQRQGYDNEQWRPTAVNGDYELCPSYPATLWVPYLITDDELEEVFKFRSRGRIPALTYYHAAKQTAIVRCAQPNAGLANSYCEEDERLLNLICRASGNPGRFIIFDCRSSNAAQANRFRGKGTEQISRYENGRMLFMELANIHTMRNSIDSLKQVLEDPSSTENDWYMQLNNTGWMQHIRSILNAAITLAKQIAIRGVSVVVHCSDGWDRTSQCCFLAQVLLDPYFRTIKGFQDLIRKDWLGFGYKFSDRDLDWRIPDERSPVFFQCMEIVYHIMDQYPTAFEFTAEYLVFLIDHTSSGWFGNFLFNCERERTAAATVFPRVALHIRTPNIWDVTVKTNPLYEPNDQILMPIASLKVMRFFTHYFLRYDSKTERLKIGISKEDAAMLARDDPEMGETTYEALKDSTHAQRGRGLHRGESVVIWQPNEDFSECSDCARPFTLTRRRHHCRGCGHVYCGRCVENRIELPDHFGYSGVQRVCERCMERYGPIEQM